MKVWEVMLFLAIGFVLSFFTPGWVSFGFIAVVLAIAFALATRNERRNAVPRPPLVLCIDNSGSMHGKPTEWARLLTVELLARCRKAKRTLHVLHYDHEAPVTTTYPEGEGELYWPICNGGTRFDLVLTEAMRLAGDSGHIMFVTDGVAPVADGWLTSFNQAREEQCVQVDSWQIASTSDPRWTDHLLKFSRNATSVSLDTDVNAIANKAQEA